MTDHRPDVTEVLLTAGWTRTTREGELHLGDTFWRATTQPGDSAIRRGPEWIAEFESRCPVIVIVAACLAAAGQPVEQLADVIQLRPEGTPVVADRSLDLLHVEPTPDTDATPCHWTDCPLDEGHDDPHPSA